MPKSYTLTILRNDSTEYNTKFDWNGNVELRERLATWSSVLQPGEKLSYTVEMQG